MKYFFSIIISLLFSYYGIAQTPITGKVIDSSTQLSVPEVEISTSDSNKIFTNSEGKFYLNYTGGSVKFQNVYYQEKEIPNIKDNSVISLTPLKIVDIDEIVVKSPKSIVEEAFKELKNNYVFYPYSETFFLRGSIKQNYKLLRTIDLAGKIQRKTLFLNPAIKENSYKASISNIRKAGKISTDNETEYFRLFTLKEILYQANLIGADFENYIFYKSETIDSLYTKVYFTTKENTNTPLEGHYIINNTDKAILSVYYQTKGNQSSEPFTSKDGCRWRTTNYKVFVSFSYNSSLHKYTQSNCIFNYKVEFFNKKKEKNLYDLDYQLLLSNPGTSDISSNTSINKEIFKISGTYNEEFWKNQNQLLLTQEMKDFINSLQDNKEYKVILNK